MKVDDYAFYCKVIVKIFEHFLNAVAVSRAVLGHGLSDITKEQIKKKRKTLETT